MLPPLVVMGAHTTATEHVIITYYLPILNRLQVSNFEGDPKSRKGSRRVKYIMDLT